MARPRTDRRSGEDVLLDVEVVDDVDMVELVLLREKDMVAMGGRLVAVVVGGVK